MSVSPIACGATDYHSALTALPLVTPAALLRGRRLLVIAPHPDDESLGVGGLIAATVGQGTTVTVVFLTDGERSHVGSPTWPPERLARCRREEARRALTALGVSPVRVHFLGLGDTQLAVLPPTLRAAAMARLVKLVVGDTLVCVTAATDPHIDHQAAAALVSDTRWRGDVEVMHYPVWTWVQPAIDLPSVPPRGVRVAIDAELPRKREAIAAHRSQHGQLIEDATEAFVLAPVLLDHFLQTTETLLWPR